MSKLAKYGTEFRPVKKNLTGKNFKIRDKRVLFIESAADKRKTPYEAMMPRRVYAVIGRDGKVKSITYTDRLGMAKKFIDVNMSHDGVGRGELGHVHVGYYRETTRWLNRSERKLVRRVLIANGESITPEIKKRGKRRKK